LKQQSNAPDDAAASADKAKGERVREKAHRSVHRFYNGHFKLVPAVGSRHCNYKGNAVLARLIEQQLVIEGDLHAAALGHEGGGVNEADAETNVVIVEQSEVLERGQGEKEGEGGRRGGRKDWT
jgi:hypothetical protein